MITDLHCFGVQSAGCMVTWLTWIVVTAHFPVIAPFLSSTRVHTPTTAAWCNQVCTCAHPKLRLGWGNWQEVEGLVQRLFFFFFSKKHKPQLFDSVASWFYILSCNLCSTWKQRCDFVITHTDVQIRVWVWESFVFSLLQRLTQIIHWSISFDPETYDLWFYHLIVFYIAV